MGVARVMVGDALVLAGLCLVWQCWPALALVPLDSFILSSAGIGPGRLYASHEICERCRAVQQLYQLPFCARHATDPTYMSALHSGYLQPVSPQLADAAGCTPSASGPVAEPTAREAGRLQTHRLPTGHVAVRQVPCEQAIARVERGTDQPSRLQPLAASPLRGSTTETDTESAARLQRLEEATQSSAHHLARQQQQQQQMRQQAQHPQHSPAPGGKQGAGAWRKAVFKDNLASDLLAILQDLDHAKTFGDVPAAAASAGPAADILQMPPAEARTAQETVETAGVGGSSSTGFVFDTTEPEYVF
jgi:hypothetical protein